MNNTKLFYIAIVFSLSSLISKSQENRFQFGFETGPGLKYVNGFGPFFYKEYASPGFSAGIYNQVKFAKAFQIKSGIYYNRKGATIKGLAIDVAGNARGNFVHFSKYDYVTLPVLLKFNLGKKINPFFSSGIYLSYLLNHTSKEVIYSQTITSVDKLEDTQDFKSTDFGLTNGVGIEFPFANTHFTIEIRNDHALTYSGAFERLQSYNYTFNEGGRQWLHGSYMKLRTTSLILGIIFTPSSYN